MTRITRILLVVLCSIGASLFSQIASGVVVSAPSPKGAFTAGSFSGGGFSLPTGAGLNDATNIVQAISDASGAVTVGVVSFTANSGQVTPAGGIVWGSGGGQSPATTGDTNLNTLLSTETLTFGATPINGTASGLINGLRYRLQLLIYDGDTNVKNETYRGTSTLVVGGVDTLNNYSEWRTLNVADGTFTSSSAGFLNYDFNATGTTIGFALSGGAANLLAAFDVRVIPEPGCASVLFVMIGTAMTSRIGSKHRARA